ncbi:hypothetical protein [Halomonas sp.]|uniref:hypothetical protein n=1 Tax=Halomonas sp. TaxID=1486246 RepID=UPI00384DB587
MLIVVMCIPAKKLLFKSISAERRRTLAKDDFPTADTPRTLPDGDINDLSTHQHRLRMLALLRHGIIHNAQQFVVILRYVFLHAGGVEGSRMRYYWPNVV